MAHFHDHCNHGSQNYAGDIDGRDLYFFKDHAGFWSYCLRSSDEPSDYSSGPVKYWFLGNTGFSTSLNRDVVVREYNKRGKLIGKFLQFIGIDVENL